MESLEGLKLKENYNLLKGRKILITGATGFLGSHLAKRLVKEGAKVHVWVRSSSSLWRLSEIQERLSLHVVDMCDQLSVNNACQKINPEIVYHLAAYGVHYQQQDIKQALDTNVVGTVNLIRGLKGTACKKFVHTSTSAEYGHKDHPIRETDSLEPSGIYASTKAAASLIAPTIAEQCGISLLIMRLFTVYGPFESPFEREDKFVPYIILSLLNGNVPELTTCRQVRDYIYVEDVVEAYLKAADISIDEPLTLNIGSGIPITLRDLVQDILKFFNDAEVLFGAVPHRKKEIWQAYADITKAREVLGWQAKTPLKEGLLKTIEWFKQHRIKIKEGEKDGDED
jgi:nucleoside-diphosphate-sugar epimerase